MVAPVNDRDVMLQAATRDLDPRANKYLNLTVTTPIFHVASNGVASPSTITISATPVNIGGGTVVFSLSAGTLTGSGNTRTLDFTNMPADSATLTASITDLGQTYTATQVISKVVDGLKGQDGSSTAAPMYAAPQLFKWSTTQPSLPTGSSTWAWSTGSNTGYLGSDGWYTSAPANPGTPSVQLWVVTKPITAASGTDTTNVTYTSGASLVAVGANGTQGVAGIKSDRACVYAWAIGPAPTISGTSVYTWSTQSFNSVPAGWSATKPDAPALGYTLYEASVGLVETTSSDTTNVDWTQARRVGIGYIATNGAVGPTGNSIAIAYTLVTGNTLAASPATFVASGTNLPTTGTWGETRAWTSQPSVPAAGQSVFQSVGVYNGTNTTWGLPFLSSLRVGNLSAVAVDTGTLNISGTFSSANGNFSVDSNGNATMKSVTIKAADGTTILSSGTTLNPAYAAAGTLNSAISLNSNGTLAGGGGGQVTINGLGYSGDLNATYGAIAGSTLRDSGGTVLADSAIKNAAITMNSNGTLSGAGGGQVTYLPVQDTRSVNTAPSGYPVGHQKEFKSCTAIGLSTGATYCTVETVKGWQDSSGGEAIQWAYVSSGEVWKRSAGASAASWGAWVRDMDRNLYTGDLNATYGATLGSNVGGQITTANINALIAAGAIGSTYIADLAANKITAGTLAAGVVYAGTINASQINAGTIASNIIYAGSIGANQITAGTLAAGVVYAGTVSASQVSAANLSAISAKIGTLDNRTGNAGTVIKDNIIKVYDANGVVRVKLGDLSL